MLKKLKKYEKIANIEEYKMKNIDFNNCLIIVNLFEYEDKIVSAFEDYEIIFSLLDILFTMTNSLLI